MSDSLRPHEMQHARPPCPSPTPEVYPDSCASSGWCHPAISSFVFPFSSCPQSLPASGTFPMSQLFAWGGQSIGVSTSASVRRSETSGTLFLMFFSKMTRLPDILFYKTFGMLKLLKRSSLGKSTEWHSDYGDQEGLHLKTDKEVSHPFKHFAPHLLWVQIWCINRSNSIWWPIKNVLGTSYAIAWAQEYKWSSLFEDSVSDHFPTS